MTDINQQPSPSTAQVRDPDASEQRTGGTKPADPEPETERGGSPAPQCTSRTNEEESDAGNS